MPEDWTVFIADIKNSTQAIEQGYYKEVNLIGAASITLCIQALDGTEFPFIFGGDGASLCIPPQYTAIVSHELAKLIRFAKDKFALKLRIAKIPASIIYQNDKELLVAKLEITEGRCISLFRGGGLDYADQLAKQQDAQFKISTHDSSVAELKGLSCRWSPIPANKGTIASMLVVARGSDANHVYRDILQRIRTIINCSIEEANPISLSYGQYKSFWQALKDEYRYHAGHLNGAFLGRIIDIILSVLIFRHHINPVFFLFNDKTYSESINQHSDYRKFDDTLRLIIDCRESEFRLLQEELERAYLNGHIYYGLHASKNALMTCFVESTQQGEHLHFIDGGDGGLAMAAKQLKSQLKLHKIPVTASPTGD